MVLNCVAYGCNNLHDPRNNIPFHTFPFKRLEILELWIKAIRRENWYPSKTSRICGQHFLESDYQNRPRSSLKLLKPDAVPSVFSFPKHLMKPNAPRRLLKRVKVKTVNCMEATEIASDISNIPSTSQETNRLVDVGTQTQHNDEEFYSLRKKVKSLKQKVRRKELKISNMKNLIQEISKSGCSNENLDAVLKNYFEGFPLEFLLHEAKYNEVASSGQRRYSPIMKQFVHTLYFYSPKAYNFVRQHFVLPNPRTIRKWLCKVNCQPGFLMEVLEFLKEEVKRKPNIKQCALIFDSMAIRKQLIYDDKEGRFVGNVDYGGVVDTDFETEATEALFFQIVSYSGSFKCPVAYFLINKADANLQSQLVNCCLRNLFDVGINVRSITCDGTATNISTYNKLGCNVAFDKIVSYLPHPCTDNKVYCMLDTCHMLKLARNALSEKQLSSNKGAIKWEYLKRLNELQEDQQLRLANSLTSNHINYKNRIMNVQLAVQTLSSGVADALEFLKNSNHSDFQDSDATIEFIRMTDRLFDMLNSRNPFGKGYKAPIRPSTLNYYEEVFEETTKYLQSLSIDGTPLLCHNRKTFALGFIMTMKSTLGLAKDLFNLKENPLKYLLCYKCSQDHLELYFSCIRSRGGWNNNPNAMQLKWALRQLLFRNSITCSINANCTDFGSSCTPAFEFRSENRSNLEEDNEDNNDFDILQLMDVIDLTYYQENVIYYISGYIVNKLVKKTTCSACVNILLFRDKDLKFDHTYAAESDHYKNFINAINRGGLLNASNIVYQIVLFIEKMFRLMITEGLINKKVNIKNKLQNAAINNFACKLSLFQPEHPKCEEFIFEDLHEFQLIKRIADIFIKCRLHHHAKLSHLKMHGKEAPIRQKMTKLILFKNC